MKNLIWLALAGAALTPVATTSAQATTNPPEVRVCDASACITYWNIGTPTNPVWIIVKIEPITRGEPNVN